MSARDHELEPANWQQFEATLLATARAIRRAYKIRYKELDLNLNEAGMLSMLDQAGAMSQTKLARNLGMSRAAAGSVIDSLEERSLIERRAHPEDRRAWLIALRPEGETLLEPIGKIGNVLRREIRAGIPPAERQHLSRLLLQLHDNLAGVLAEVEEGD